MAAKKPYFLVIKLQNANSTTSEQKWAVSHFIKGENAHKSIEFFIKDSSTEVVPGKNGLISLLLQKPALLGEIFFLRTLTCEKLGTENPWNSTSPIERGVFGDHSGRREN